MGGEESAVICPAIGSVGGFEEADAREGDGASSAGFGAVICSACFSSFASVGGDEGRDGLGDTTSIGAGIGVELGDSTSVGVGIGVGED